MFRGHSILIYFAVCATSLAGWNANIWPASNTSPRYVVSSVGGTNIYAKDMWSWQCHSALVERASLAGVAPPTGTNFYRYEHDNLQAMKDWVEAYCTNYLAITGTVEQLEETLATGIAFTDAVHYWTPTGMIAAFNLPMNFFDYTPYRDLNNYAGTLDPRVVTNYFTEITNDVMMIVTNEPCPTLTTNCTLWFENCTEIDGTNYCTCAYYCTEVPDPIVTTNWYGGWDMLRLCITNLKWTYQQSSSNYVTETVYHYSTNHYYEYFEYFLKRESVDESGDCCSTTWSASCTNVDGYSLSCTAPELTMSESNSWNYWPDLKVKNSFHCEYESYNEDLSCHSSDSCGPGGYCIYKDTYRFYANQNRLDYGYYSNSFSGNAYVENTQTVGATIYMWQRLNVDVVNTNKTYSEYYYNSATGVTSCSAGDCHGANSICETPYAYYYCEYACANAGIIFSGITVTGRIDLAYGAPDYANYWKLNSTQEKEANDFRLAFDIYYSRWSPMSTVIVDNTSGDTANISCPLWGSYYSEKTMFEEKTEYLLYADGNPADPQVPYYLFEWKFEYD